MRLLQRDMWLDTPKRAGLFRSFFCQFISANMSSDFAKKSDTCKTDHHRVEDAAFKSRRYIITCQPHVNYGVRSPKFNWAPAVFIGWLGPRNSPPPTHAFGLLYEGAIGRPRQTTSLCNPLIKAVSEPTNR